MKTAPLTYLSLVLIWFPGGPAQGQARLEFPPEVDHRIEHPNPRTGVSGAAVLPPSVMKRQYGDAVGRAYAVALAIPEVLDGIHSYCRSGRSLLSCFESPAAANCDFCILAATRIYGLRASGRSLEFIRRWHVEPVAGDEPVNELVQYDSPGCLKHYDPRLV
jgi:hypothetical protein